MKSTAVAISLGALASLVYRGVVVAQSTEIRNYCQCDLFPTSAYTGISSSYVPGSIDRCRELCDANLACNGYVFYPPAGYGDLNCQLVTYSGIVTVAGQTSGNPDYVLPGTCAMYGYQDGSSTPFGNVCITYSDTIVVPDPNPGPGPSQRSRRQRVRRS